MVNVKISKPIVNGNEAKAVSNAFNCNTDWKKRKIMTLRHAAGCDKYITIKDYKRRTNNKKIDKKIIKRVPMQ